MKVELNPIIGNIRGKLGDLVFRQVNGKTYASRRPISGRVKSGAEINRQRRFAVSCKLAKCINDIDIYRQFWKKEAKGKMSTYNAIQRSNYHIIGPNSFESEPILTPDSGSLNFNEFGFCFDGKRITMEMDNERINLVRDFKKDNMAAFAGVICLSVPMYRDYNEIMFIGVRSDSEKVEKDKFTMLSVELNEIEKQTVEMYKMCMFYFGFVSMDKEGNVVNEVSTFGENLFPDSD